MLNIDENVRDVGGMLRLDKGRAVDQAVQDLDEAVEHTEMCTIVCDDAETDKASVNVYDVS